MVQQQVMDAGELLGSMSTVDTKAVDEIALGDAQRRISEGMPTDLARMYHPDGTTSLILLPPLGKGGRGLGDRRRKIMHYMVDKKGPHGEQWWFPTPPEGWAPKPLPIRCPVTECTRAGGLPNLKELWNHIQHKHPGEVPLYQGLLNQIQAKLETQLGPDLAALLNDTPATTVACVSCGEPIAGKLADHVCEEGT